MNFLTNVEMVFCENFGFLLKDWTKAERKCLHAFILAEFGHARVQSGCANGELTVKRRRANSSDGRSVEMGIGAQGVSVEGANY